MEIIFETWVYMTVKCADLPMTSSSHF